MHVVKPYMDDVNHYTFNLGITRFEEPAAASARGTYARPLTIGFSRSTNSYTHFISPAACIIHVVRDGLFTSSVSPTQIRSSGLGLRLNDCSTNSGVVSSAGFYPDLGKHTCIYPSAFLNCPYGVPNLQARKDNCYNPGHHIRITCKIYKVL